MAELTREYLKSLYVYDSETGNFLHNPSRPRETFRTSRGYKIWRSQYAGKLAGAKPRQDGCRLIWIDGRLYLAHRLAWLYAHGEMPHEEIDHIDGDRSNNSLNNLRQASHAQNSRNLAAHKDGKVPYRGVHEHRPGVYRASICVDGISTHIGLFETPEEAALAYDKAAIKSHGEFCSLNFPEIHSAPQRTPRRPTSNPFSST